MFNEYEFNEVTFNYETPTPPPAVSLPADPKNYNGYLCFMQQYIKNKYADKPPLKLPDGTLWE